MNALRIRIVALAIVPALTIALVSCSGGGAKTEEETTVLESADSALVVNTYQVQATISAIDPQQRMITLTDSSGSSTNVKASPRMGSLGAFAVDDHVLATITEDFAAYLRPAGAAPSESDARLIGLATAGDESATVQAVATQQTAEVVAVSPVNRSVSLLMVDGRTRTFRVHSNVNLSNVQVGDSVTVGVAESVAITMNRN
jgi:hypothetical protein